MTTATHGDSTSADGTPFGVDPQDYETRDEYNAAIQRVKERGGIGGDNTRNVPMKNKLKKQ